MGEPSKDSTQCPQNLPFTLHHGMQPMWEGSTYLTSQSMMPVWILVAPGVRLFKKTAAEITKSSQEYLVCWEKNTV